MTVSPVISKVSVRTAPARAFDLFVNHMAQWWTTCHAGEKPFAAIVVEPMAGGRWYERDAKGRETERGKVLSYEPPHRLLLGWCFNVEFQYAPDIMTEVEITFTANQAGGTDVRLEHRNLERFGADAARVASSVGGGWPTQMGSFAAFTDQHQKQEA
jgi:uncharacterized protein YndB with AHSA1/START domain